MLMITVDASNATTDTINSIKLELALGTYHIIMHAEHILQTSR